MKLLENIINTEIRLQMQTLDQGLDITPTSHDRNFVKHITNMKSTDGNNRYEHKDLILI